MIPMTMLPTSLVSSGRSLLAGLLVLATAGVVGGQSLLHSAPNPITKTWVFDIDPDRKVPQYDFGAAVRVRYVDFQDVIALGAEPDPHRRFFRVRTRLWGERWFTQGWRLFARINNESRSYLKCDDCESKFDEIIFENLFFEFTNQKGNPFGLRMGRQDLFYGDGFVICDGTPLDGSRTSYVNGILLTAAIPSWSFDLFAAWNREEEEWLPRINSRYTRLLEYDEFVGGLYVRGFNPEARPKPYTIDYYYIYKQEETSERHATINTFGSRFVLALGPADVTGELAYQGGKAPESRFALASPDLAGSQDISAYGGQAKLAFRSPGGLPLSFNGGYVHLSGDDPLTRNKFEGWNPVMGRWPKWSELYIYTLTMEGYVQPMGQGVAYWQNFKAPHVGVAVSPYKNITLEAGHMWMRADTSVPFDPRVSPEAEAERPKDRGNLLTVKLSWRVKSALPVTGHILYERFDPGGYYDPGVETAHFLRFELSTSL
jgi:hypothetical protein